MKRFAAVPVLAVLVVIIVAGRPVQQGLTSADEAAIRKSIESYAEAVLASDWAGLAAMHTEDAVVMPPNEPAVQGRAALEAWGEAWPPITEFSTAAVEIDGRGDLAFVRGTFAMTIMPEGTPEPIQDTGKYVEIWRKQPDGSWLIAVDIFNSDLPLPE